MLQWRCLKRKDRGTDRQGCLDREPWVGETRQAAGCSLTRERLTEPGEEPVQEGRTPPLYGMRPAAPCRMVADERTSAGKRRVKQSGTTGLPPVSTGDGVFVCPAVPAYRYRKSTPERTHTMKYDFSAIESKWQKRWEEAHIFEAQDASDKPKFYGLVEFPYPSGVGMHVGAYQGILRDWRLSAASGVCRATMFCFPSDLTLSDCRPRTPLSRPAFIPAS